jgi:hypothetical protein
LTGAEDAGFPTRLATLASGPGHAAGDPLLGCRARVAHDVPLFPEGRIPEVISAPDPTYIP